MTSGAPPWDGRGRGENGPANAGNGNRSTEEPSNAPDTDDRPGDAAGHHETADPHDEPPSDAAGPPESNPAGKSPGKTPAGGSPPDDGPPDAGAGPWGSTGPDQDESPEEHDTGRSIPYPVRLGHGLIDLIERLPKHAIPTSGGHTATVVVTLRHDQLLTGLGTATLNTGTTISATQALRLACQAGLVPAVLDGDGAPLHLGHERRLHPKHHRIGMELRDGPTCALDGCDIPAAFCHAHHVVPWSEGGQTSLDDGILICPHHHNLAHHPHWQLTRQHGVWRLRKVDPRKQTP